MSLKIIIVGSAVLAAVGAVYGASGWLPAALAVAVAFSFYFDAKWAFVGVGHEHPGAGAGMRRLAVSGLICLCLAYCAWLCFAAVFWPIRFFVQLLNR